MDVDPFDRLGDDEDEEDEFNDPFDRLDAQEDTPANGEDEGGAPIAPAAPWYSGLLDTAASAVNGATMNRADDLTDMAGNAAEAIGWQGGGDALHGAAESFRNAEADHPMANMAGKTATGITGAAIAGPGVLAQAGAGALMGAADEDGSAVGGGLWGAAGGAAGKVLGAVGDRTLGAAAELVPNWARRMGRAANVAMGKPAGAPRPTGVGRGLGELAGQSVGGAGAANQGTLDQALDQVTGNVQMPETSEKASASQGTMNWAVQDSLATKSSGLPQEAEEQLNQVLMSGNRQQQNAVSYVLQQRHPQYAKVIADRLRGLTRDGD